MIKKVWARNTMVLEEISLQMTLLSNGGSEAGRCSPIGESDMFASTVG